MNLQKLMEIQRSFEELQHMMEDDDDFHALWTSPPKLWPLIIKWITDRKKYRDGLAKKINELKMYDGIENKLGQILKLQHQKLARLQAQRIMNAD